MRGAQARSSGPRPVRRQSAEARTGARAGRRAGAGRRGESDPGLDIRASAERCTTDCEPPRRTAPASSSTRAISTKCSRSRPRARRSRGARARGRRRSRRDRSRDARRRMTAAPAAAIRDDTPVALAHARAARDGGVVRHVALVRGERGRRRSSRRGWSVDGQQRAWLTTDGAARIRLRHRGGGAAQSGRHSSVEVVFRDRGPRRRGR